MLILPELAPDEQLDDLLLDGLYIIQKKNTFRYGTDAVALSNFAAEFIGRDNRVLDIGTGTGIIPILLSSKTCASYICGIDILPQMCNLAKRSVAMNGLEGRIEILNADIKDAEKYFQIRSFDCIVTNPPYKRRGTGIVNNVDDKTVARHETTCTLEDIVKEAARLLRPYGHFTMINRPERLTDALTCMRQYKLEPKELCFIHAQIDKPPVLFMIHCVLFGGMNLVVRKPVILEGA